MRLSPSAHARKMAWQRENRRAFAAKHGFSSSAHYACGGNREAVLKRDNYSCVKCGMTDKEHMAKWGEDRHITVDHKDKDRSNNSMENLQTLCLSCHGNKDLIPRLRERKIEKFKAQVLKMRGDGFTYQEIADSINASLGGVYKCCKQWGIT